VNAAFYGQRLLRRRAAYASTADPAARAPGKS
jgi:hypothetical protein